MRSQEGSDPGSAAWRGCAGASGLRSRAGPQAGLFPPATRPHSLLPGVAGLQASSVVRQGALFLGQSRLVRLLANVPGIIEGILLELWASRADRQTDTCASRPG